MANLTVDQEEIRRQLAIVLRYSMPAMIENQVSTVHSDGESQTGEATDSEQICPICRMPFADGGDSQRTPIFLIHPNSGEESHIFCQDCIRCWFFIAWDGTDVTAIKNECPMCREEIFDKSYPEVSAILAGEEHSYGQFGGWRSGISDYELVEMLAEVLGPGMEELFNDLGIDVEMKDAFTEQIVESMPADWTDE